MPLFVHFEKLGVGGVGGAWMSLESFTTAYVVHSVSRIRMLRFVYCAGAEVLRTLSLQNVKLCMLLQMLCIQ